MDFRTIRYAIPWGWVAIYWEFLFDQLAHRSMTIKIALRDPGCDETEPVALSEVANCDSP